MRKAQGFEDLLHRHGYQAATESSESEDASRPHVLDEGELAESGCKGLSFEFSE
jgi:hypothetical protein